MHKTSRMCVSCKQRKDKSELIRISKKDDSVVIDQEKKQNARAIYVCKDIKCIENLKKNKAINRFLGLSTSEEFYVSLKKQIY